MSQGPDSKLPSPLAPLAPSITDDPRHTIKQISKRREAFHNQVSSINKRTQEQMESREQAIQATKNFSGVRILFCGLCNSRLVKSKKTIHNEVLNMDTPIYKCSVCSAKYNGFIPFIRHSSKSDLLAEIVEYQ